MNETIDRKAREQEEAKKVEQTREKTLHEIGLLINIDPVPFDETMGLWKATVSYGRWSHAVIVFFDTGERKWDPRTRSESLLILKLTSHCRDNARNDAIELSSGTAYGRSWRDALAEYVYTWAR